MASSDWPWQGPAGEIAPGQRVPFDEGQMPGSDFMPAPPQPDMYRADPKQPMGLQLDDELVAWRPVPVFVGTVSADLEVHLFAAYRSGPLVRRVTLWLRSAHTADAADYWTIGIYWRDGAGNDELIAEITTETEDVGANVLRPVYHDEAGVRLEENHELTAKFTKSGSAANLTEVGLQADVFIGIGRP